MAAPPAPIALFIAAFQAAGIVVQADLAPLVTQAQLNAALAAQLAPMQAQLAAMQAQIHAQIHALLAPHNAPAIAAASTAIVQATFAARAQNAHDRSGEAYAAVPLADGTLAPNWPVGFERTALVSGPIDVVDTLLGDFGLPHGAPLTLLARRNALARHIGTTLV